MQLYDKDKTDELLALKLSDAPSDGTIYARKDAGWVNVSGGGLTVSNVSTDYTLVLGDANKALYINGSSGYPGNGLTVPDNATVAFPVGTQIHLFVNNGGSVYLSAGSGSVTLIGNTTLPNQTKATLTQTATDVWFIG